MASRRHLFLGIVLGGCLLPLAALAQPSAADKDSARRLMSEAREKRDAKDLQGALQLFTAADGIMHVPTTGLEVARTEAALGQLVVARDTALRVARTTAAPHEPAQFAPARDAAQALSDDLAKRIPTMKLTLHGVPPGVEPRVVVDGETLPPAAILVPRPLDPGRHHITATAGGAGGAADVDLVEGESKDAVVELVASAPAPAPTPTPKKPQETHGGIGTPLMIGGFGLGGVGLVVGTVAGITSAAKTSSIKSACQDNRCPLSSASDIQAARSAATVSNVGFIVGAAGAVVGVVGFVLWRREGRTAEAPPQAIRVTPWIGTACAGAGVTGAGVTGAGVSGSF